MNFEGSAGVVTHTNDSLAAYSIASREQQVGPRTVLTFPHGEMHARLTRFDPSPKVAQIGNCVIAWCGTLHNGHELKSQLGLRPEETETAVVTAIYSKWGALGFAILLGDFCLALWDQLKSQLLLARDAIGTRQLVFHRNSRRTLFASDIRYILGCSEIESTPDELYVGTFCVGVPDMSRSPFKGIDTVPPGHAVVITRESCTRLSLWDISTKRTISYASAPEYEAHFFHLFARSLESRLRGCQSVVAELSGGLDSSSIVCMTDKLVELGAVSTESVRTFSLVFNKAVRSDEREYIKTVEDFRDTRSSQILFDDLELLSDFSFNRWYDGPAVMRCFGSLHSKVADQFKSADATVLFSGFGGDQVLWGGLSYPHDVTNALSLGEINLAWRRMRRWSTISNKPLPHVIWNSVAPLVGHRPSFHTVPQWLDKKFAKRISIIDRLHYRYSHFDKNFELQSQRIQAAFIADAIALVSSGAMFYHPDEGTIRQTFPFLDRPLVDYMLSIPIEAVVDAGDTKTLLRRALSEVLPPETANRRSKSSPHHGIHIALQEGFERNIRHLMDSPRCVEHGFVDVVEFRRHLMSAKYGQAIGGDTILELLSLELWLRSLEYRPVAGTELANSYAICN